MNQYIRYLSGYTLSVLIGVAAAASVACFMASSTSLPFAAVATLSCFLLNLLLFWQEFDHLLTLPQKLTWANAIPIFSIVCGSILTYTFTTFALFSLTNTFALAHMLFPSPVIHIIALASAIGCFEMYIDCFTNLVDNQFSKLPFKDLGLAMLLFGILLGSPVHPVPLFTASLLLIGYMTSPERLLKTLAITASVFLSLNGLGASLPTLYRLAQSHLALYALKGISYIGLFALTLCDALYCRAAMHYILKHKLRYDSISSYLGLGLVTCNAIANSQITASGKGFFNLQALLGGYRSTLLMTKSTQNMAKKKAPQPPLSQDEHMAILLFFYNALWYTGIRIWLGVFRPATYRQLSRLLSKPILGNMMTTGGLAKMAMVSSHVYLWFHMPSKKRSDGSSFDLSFLRLLKAKPAV